MVETPPDVRALLDRATQELRRLRLEINQMRHEPIAIVGMACRFPGGADSPEAFWQNLRAGKDCIKDTNARWGGPMPGGGNPPPAVRWAGLLDDVEHFDADFFNISPREANRLDPQQRMLLEVAWEALEGAGYPSEKLLGSPTGVYVGTLVHDYEHELFDRLQSADVYSVTGAFNCFTAGRLSYTLGLQGPCLNLDSACSSSIVAIHLASQSLRNGESKVALACAVNLIVSPLNMYMMAQTQALSADGRCKTFDARANGYVRGEGCGVLVLKRLCDAQRDGDRVLGIIRGTAVNQDGKSAGLTAPSGQAQVQVLRTALQNACIKPEQISYIEAHGTGTSLGDPIEMESLREVYGVPRPDGSALPVGSVKTNVGHLEAAAGMASVIKVLKGMENDTVPRHLHFETLNPRIRLQGTPFVIPTEARPWPRGEQPRVAAISGFAMSGTNAHMIIEEPPRAAAVPEARPAFTGSLLLPVSARTPQALRAMALRYADFLDSPAGRNLALHDITWTASTRRSHHAYRLVVRGKDHTALSAALRTQAAESRAEAVQRRQAAFECGDATSDALRGAAFLLTHPVARVALDACAAALADAGAPAWQTALQTGGAADPLTLTVATFAMQCALAALARSVGMEPMAVHGVGIGAIAATHVAGLLSLEDAAKLAVWRGRGMQGAAPTMSARANRCPVYMGARPAPVEGDVFPSLMNAQGFDATAEQTAAVLREAAVAPWWVLGSRSHGTDALQKVLDAEPTADLCLVTMAPNATMDDSWLDTCAMLHTLGVPVDFAQLQPAGRHVTLPTYAWQRKRYWVEPRDTSANQTVTSPAKAPKVAFLFTGQGAQHAGMAKGLYDREPRFRAALERLCAIAEPLVPQPLLPLMLGTAANPQAIHDTALAQPILLAFELALVELWRSWGVEPAMLLGHSVGEYAAACVAGVLTPEAAMRLVCARGRLMQALPRHGAMAVVFTSLEQVQQAMDAAKLPQLALAAVNGPKHVTISGLNTSVRSLMALLDAQHIKCRLLEVSHAFHSPLLDPMLDAFEAVAKEHPMQAPRLPLVSNLTGTPWGMDAPPDAHYWRRHARAPVAFGQGFAALLTAGCDTFIEVGPDDTLIKLGRSNAEGAASLTWHASHGRGDTTTHVLDEAVQQLQNKGISVQRAAAPQSAAWTYVPSWQPVALPQEAVARAEIWCVCTDDKDLSQAIAQAARAQGVTCHGSAMPDGAPTVTAWQTLLKDAQRTVGHLDRVLYAAPTAGNGNGDAQTSAAMRHGGAITALLQALANTQTRLTLVTRGALAVSGAPVDVWQATVWGLGRVAALEMPHQWGGLVDLDPKLPASAAATRLVHHMCAGDGENQVALRGEARFGARLEARVVSSDATAPWTLKDNATYVITGGVGALGLLTAEEMVRRGARHLALLSRRATQADASAQNTIAQLRAQGATVTLVDVDVTQRDALRDALAPLHAEHPIRGIVHAAGLESSVTLQQLEPARFSDQLAPKVLGAWWLHTLSAAWPLDFMVFYSSMASYLPGKGQAQYAAGNAFLDSLAHARRAAGLPALSLNRGRWEARGMVSDALADVQARIGLRSMANPRALAALGECMQSGIPQVMIADIDWTRFRPAFESTGVSMLLDNVSVKAAAPKPSRGDMAPTPWLKRLQGAASAARLGVLQDFVVGLLNELLQRDSNDPLDVKRPFMDMGVDSLRSVELRDRLRDALGLDALPATLTFDHPTVARLCAHLLTCLPNLAESSAAPMMRAVVQAGTNALHEPIAVIGIGCRFPGGSNGPEQFWRNLAAGFDAVDEVPRERWNMDAYFDADPDAPGKINSRWMGALRDIDQFDAPFFEISPREAEELDPQQRLLLEVSWEALEHAGINPNDIFGSQTSVLVGISMSDYAQLRRYAEDPSDITPHTLNGAALNAAAGRIAYWLGLQGPAMAVDTACSSSLVALHLGVQQLRNGECDLALAGGVNVILSPQTTITAARAHLLSPAGRCRAFDASGDGLVRSEGCGMVVLKRLSDALRDGDSVLAVVRGSAVNQDGRSSSLTAPSGPSQEAVMKRALQNAQLDANAVQYIEAHGTGTALGDPIEVHALQHVYMAQRPKDMHLAISSVKTNIGHAESAAGVAGFIKTVLALQHETLPPHLHLRRLNTHISKDPMIAVPGAAVRWPRGFGQRVASVSSFGASGTNAHVVVAEAPMPPSVPEAQGLPVLTLSAKSDAALRALAKDLDAYLSTASHEWRDICYTANTGRAAHGVRASIVATDATAARVALRALQPTRAHAAPKIAFLFTGQGSQYPAMARSLYASQPVFKEAVDACAVHMDALLGQSIVALLTDPAMEMVKELRYGQPAVFALGYGLMRLWAHWGITPHAVIGHSAGEYTAACAAGVVRLEDACKLIVARGRLMDSVPVRGHLLGVVAEPQRVQELVQGRALDIAAYNSPVNTVVAGAEAEIEAFVTLLDQHHIEHRPVGVAQAAHSRFMDPILAPFGDVAQGMRFAPPNIDFVSTLTGECFKDGATWSVDYLRQHIRQAVRFAPGISALAHCDIFIEMGPHPVLCGLGQACLGEAPARSWAPSMHRKQETDTVLAESLGAVWAAGAPVRWQDTYTTRGRKVPLPTYPFEHRRYWIDAAPKPRPASVGAMDPFVGERLQSPAMAGVVYQARYSTANLPELFDHWVFGVVVVAGAAQIARVLRAARQMFGPVPVAIENVSFEQALALGPGDERINQLLLTPTGPRTYDFRTVSAPAGGATPEWSTHVVGRLRVLDESPPAPIDVAPWQALARDLGTVSNFYPRFTKAFNYTYGPTFQWIETVGIRATDTVGSMRAVPATTPLVAGYVDSMFQAAVAGVLPILEDGRIETYAPVGIDRLSVYKWPQGAAWFRGQFKPENNYEHVSAQIQIVDGTGNAVMQMDGFHVHHARHAKLLRGLKPKTDDLIYELQWRSDAAVRPARAAVGTLWLVADSEEVASPLASALRARGASCVTMADVATVQSMRAQGDPEGIIFVADTTASLEAVTAGALRLLQTLLAQTWRQMPRVTLVTCGAQHVTGDTMPVNLAHAPLWGMARCVALEHPELKLRCVDVDLSPTATRDLAAWLWEDEAAALTVLRPGKRYHARLTRHRSKPGTSARPIDPQGTYLVTGGAGFLGAAAVRWLLAHGATDVHVLGRAGLSDAVRVSLMEAASHKEARITGHAMDIADAAALDNTLATIRRTGRVLRGVIHCAGVLDDGALMQQTWAKFERVMGPKIRGGWNLHVATQSDPLDFFVLYSAAAAVLGNPGQTNYAAANAWMDALATERRRQNKPALSINWGPWAGGGLADTVSLPAGFRSLAVDNGMRAYEEILEGSPPVLTVVDMDWRAYLAQHDGDAGHDFLADLAPLAVPEAPKRVDIGGLLAALREAPSGIHGDIALQHVRSAVAEVLGAPDAVPDDPKRPLLEAGLDSLMAIRLARVLGQRLDRVLPSTLVLQRPNMAAVAEYLLDVLQPDLGLSSPVAAPAPLAAVPTPALAVEVAAKQVDDLTALLDEVEANS